MEHGSELPTQNSFFRKGWRLLAAICVLLGGLYYARELLQSKPDLVAECFMINGPVATPLAYDVVELRKDARRVVRTMQEAVSSDARAMTPQQKTASLDLHAKLTEALNELTSALTSSPSFARQMEISALEGNPFDTFGLGPALSVCVVRNHGNAVAEDTFMEFSRPPKFIVLIRPKPQGAQLRGPSVAPQLRRDSANPELISDPQSRLALGTLGKDDEIEIRVWSEESRERLFELVHKSGIGKVQNGIVAYGWKAWLVSLEWLYLWLAGALLLMVTLGVSLFVSLRKRTILLRKLAELTSSPLQVIVPGVTSGDVRLRK